MFTYWYYIVWTRTASARNSAKRQSTRHKKTDDKHSEKRKKRISQRRKPNLDRCDDETANLNRVLVERMLLKNSGFNQGSRSVGGTPMCLRRKKHDVNKNLSSMRLNGNPSAIRPAVIENEVVKRRSNSVRIRICWYCIFLSSLSISLLAFLFSYPHFWSPISEMTLFIVIAKF